MPASFDDPPGVLPEEQFSPPLARGPAKAEAENPLLKRLLETLPYPFSYIDADLVYRQCNAAAAATVGCTPDEIVGQSVAAVVGADSEVIGLLRQVLMGGEPHFGTVEFTAPDSGGTAFYRASYLPDIDAEGRVLGVLTNVVDVTDLVRSEQALRLSEDRLSRIARAGRIGFVEYNVASDEAYWSPEHYELFGFEDGSPVDWQRWLEGVHPEDRERVEANAARLLERAAAEGRVRGHTDEYRYVRPDGTVTWIEADMAVDVVDGQPIMRGVVRDATERKRTEEARQESEERSAFLLLLNDALRPLADPVAVQEKASRLLGEHLEADRAAYFEIRGDDYVIERDWAPSVPHLSGRFPVADFGEPLLSTYRAGRMVVMNDVAEDPLSTEERAAFAEVRVAAQISIPLVKSGELVGGLSVHSATPRTWTSQEMRLLEETAERTWAAVERAKSEAEQRRAEQAQRESEERLQIATKATALGVHDFDVRTGTIQWDARVHEMWGVPLDEPVTYETFMGGIDPDQHVRIQAAVDAALDPDGTRKFRETYRVISRDGTRRWVSAIGRVVFEGEQAVRIIGTAEDITSRVQAEQALRESESKFRSLFESSPDAVFLTIPDGNILAANPAACSLFGRSEEELLRAGRSSVIDESDPRFPAALDERQRTGHVRAVELIAIRANGERFPAEVESVIVKGEPERSFVILRDITERKRLEGEKDLLLEAASALAESIRLSDVLDQLARITLELGGHSRVVISLWQEELGCLTVARSRGEAALTDGMAVVIADLSAPARDAIEKKETRLIDYDDMEPGRRGLADEITSHLALDVPIVFGGRFVGLLATDDPGKRREFSERQVRLIEGLAAHASVAIENARLFKATEDELSRTAILREVAAAAAGMIDQGELSAQVLDACRRRLGAKAGNVYVIDREASVLHASALFGFPEELMPQLERMELDEARASARSYLKNEMVTHDSPELPSGISERAKAAQATQDRWVSLPIRARDEVVGSLGLIFPGQRAFGAEEIALYHALADQLGVGLDKARLFAGKTAARVEQAAREERARLARDLHDSVTQSLFAATLKAEALTIAAADQAPGMSSVAEELGRLSRGALAQMRTMLLELRGDPVQEVPLHQLLRNLVDATESRSSVRIRLGLGEDGTLPPDVHEAVYRITQEALNNVARHAKAQDAWVELDRQASHVRLVIGDDGCGFDPDSVEPGHFGLKSMQERTDESGGQLSLRSVQSEGTALTVEWRFEGSARKGAAG